MICSQGLAAMNLKVVKTEDTSIIRIRAQNPSSLYSTSNLREEGGRASAESVKCGVVQEVSKSKIEDTYAFELLKRKEK
jgi:hypothetical protein